MCTQVAEVSAERNRAVASKHQAAEAAAALEAEAAALLEQKKQAVTALQSQISQLKVRPLLTLIVHQTRVSIRDRNGSGVQEVRECLRTKADRDMFAQMRVMQSCKCITICEIYQGVCGKCCMVVMTICTPFGTLPFLQFFSEQQW